VVALGLRHPFARVTGGYYPDLPCGLWAGTIPPDDCRTGGGSDTAVVRAGRGAGRALCIKSAEKQN